MRCRSAHAPREADTRKHGGLPLPPPPPRGTPTGALVPARNEDMHAARRPALHQLANHVAPRARKLARNRPSPGRGRLVTRHSHAAAPAAAWPLQIGVLPVPILPNLPFSIAILQVGQHLIVPRRLRDALACARVPAARARARHLRGSLRAPGDGGWRTGGVSRVCSRRGRTWPPLHTRSEQRPSAQPPLRDADTRAQESPRALRRGAPAG